MIFKDDNAYEVEEVGLTGVNEAIDFGSIRGKNVCVKGEVMEAHTRYHYSKIMILDGATTLKVLE